MVGRETLPISIQGLPATGSSVTAFVSSSGVATSTASGGVPGQIGTWVCPGEGCQAGVCALRPTDVNTMEREKIRALVTIETAYTETSATGSC